MMTRKEFLDNSTKNAFKDKLVPFLDQHEREGEWRKLTWEPVYDYFGKQSNLEGILISYEML